MTHTLTTAALALTVLASAGGAQTPPATAAAQPNPNRGGGNCANNAYNCVDAVNPLPAPNSVWIEELTWMEVRDALKAGKTTAIIATGGMEPNGPWLVTGKHNYVLQSNCEAIARKMGNALCAPIIKLVPEGDISPKTGHMVSPGTMTMREETFAAVLTDAAESLQAHGFRNIIFIGDSGGNQRSQKAVAETLTAKWGGKALALHIAEYYDYASVAKYMTEHGIIDGASDNMHDDPIITLNMFNTDPNSVRYDARVKAGKASINGVSVADKAKNTALAKQIVEFRATKTVEAINKAIATGGKTASAQ